MARVEVVMFPHIFGQSKGRSPKAHPSRPAYRPQLDRLEDRLTPTVYTIAPSVTAGQTNTFTSLSQAVAVAVAGDQIIIDPGANPGSATIAQNNLLIEGLASAGYQGMQATGTQVPSLQLLGNGDVLANLWLGTVSIGNGSTGEIFVDSLFSGQGIAQTITTAGSFTFANDGNNTVMGCTFIDGAMVRLGNSAASNLTTAANDNISNNVFLNPLTNAIIVQNETAGLTIANNRINNTNAAGGTEFILATDCVGSISGNIINGPAAVGTVGILAKDYNDIDAETTNLTIANNVITTNQTAIEVQRFSTVDAFTVAVTNNTLAANQVGLVVTGNSEGNGSDYGNLTIEDNDFRGYSGANGNFAIEAVDSAFFPVISPAAVNTVTAQSNIFSVSNPQIVLNTANAPGTTLTVTTLLPASEANLFAMFQTLGGGPPTAAQINSFSTASLSVQAAAATTSSQAAKVFVDGLYVSLLGRMPGAGEDQTWINDLTTGGTSEETVLIGFLTSAEYYNKMAAGSANANNAWVQSLYTNLLGRQASAAEIAGWAGQIPKVGLVAIVQGFLLSAEFRTDQLAGMYDGTIVGAVFAPDLLKRHTVPSPAELAGWVNSGLKLRQLEAQLLASGEFALNG
jgi:hypothetical protein